MAAPLPPRPDFAAIEASAMSSADRRTLVLALVGNLAFSWSNNESLFIYYLMLLLDSDEVSAAIVFGTLNTTRARLDLVQRLAKAKVADQPLRRGLERLIQRFSRCNQLRNELNHCMYELDGTGGITHTLSTRIEETRDSVRFGTRRAMDEARLEEMTATITELRDLNRDLWAFLPRLEAHLGSSHGRRGGSGRERSVGNPAGQDAAPGTQPVQDASGTPSAS